MKEVINHSNHTPLMNTIRDVYRLWRADGLLWIPHLFLSNQELFLVGENLDLGQPLLWVDPICPIVFSFTSLRDVYSRKKFKNKNC